VLKQLDFIQLTLPRRPGFIVSPPLGSRFIEMFTIPNPSKFLRLAALLLVVTAASFIRAQSHQIAAPLDLRLPDETAGVDAIARVLVSAFDQADIVALGETHVWRVDTDLRIAMVRHPDFAKKVRFIVVEFASTTQQATLDRYIRGENVSKAQLMQVWKTTTQAANGVWDSPVYAEFLAAVRDVNSKLPANSRIRVLGGDPGPGDNRSRETAAVAVLKEQVLQKHGKALVIYGAAHFYRTYPAAMLPSMGDDIGLVRKLEIEIPGRSFVVIPIGRLDIPPGATLPVIPDYQKFDRALKTQVRPVLVPLQRLPFRDFTGEEFLGNGVFSCRGPGGCVSVFKGSTLTLGQMADACVYVGGSTDATLR
jgi:heme-binding uptake protein ChaN (Tiki superfamily)